MSELKTGQIQRIVVRGTNWVGDAVMTVPALRRLRELFPTAQITLATRSSTAGLFAEADFIDDLQLQSETGILSTIGQVREWRKRKFDLAVLLPNSFESALVAFLAGVPRRIGYATDGRRRLLTDRLAQPEWQSTRHEVFYYLEIVEQIGKRWADHGPMNSESAVAAADGSLRVSEARRVAAQAFLGDKVGFGREREGRPLIAICPGSVNSRAKRWPAERYATLADRFINETGAKVLLIGSPDELDVSQDVAQRMTGQPLVLTGETELAQAVAILSLVDLLVTNDTGPAHIASALGRPTLVIFGPTNPLTTQPFSPVGEIVREPPECAPCMLRDCPIDHRCMTAIEPDEVFKRATAMLAIPNEVSFK